MSYPETPDNGGAFAWDVPLSRREVAQRVLLRNSSANRWALERHLKAAADTAEAARALSSENEALRRAKKRLQSEVKALEQQREDSMVEIASLKARLKELHKGPERLQGVLDDVKRESIGLRRENNALKAEAANPTPRSRVYGLAYSAMTGMTPRDAVTPRRDGALSARGMVGMTPRSAAAVGTPRSNGYMRPPLRGSVASISWHESPYVDQLVLLSRITGQQMIFGGGNHAFEESSGSLTLRRGEFLIKVEGQTGHPPSFAAWLTLTTSEDQAITIGQQEEEGTSSYTSFTLAARQDHEIVGFILNSNGELEDIDQRLLPPSRLGQTPRGSDIPSPPKMSSGTISRIKAAVALTES